MASSKDLLERNQLNSGNTWHQVAPTVTRPVEVDIARNKFSGTISLNSAYDPKGQRMHTFPKD